MCHSERFTGCADHQIPLEKEMISADGSPLKNPPSVAEGRRINAPPPLRYGERLTLAARVLVTNRAPAQKKGSKVKADTDHKLILKRLLDEHRYRLEHAVTLKFLAGLDSRLAWAGDRESAGKIKMAIMVLLRNLDPPADDGA